MEAKTGKMISPWDPNTVVARQHLSLQKTLLDESKQDVGSASTKGSQSISEKTMAFYKEAISGSQI